MLPAHTWVPATSQEAAGLVILAEGNHNPKKDGVGREKSKQGRCNLLENTKRCSSCGWQTLALSETPRV